GVVTPCGVPTRHTLQLDPPDNGLGLHHSPIRAEAVVQPAEAGRVRALVHGLPALAVILVGPHPRPQRFVRGGDHAAFSAGGHDLVLAEGPCADVADGSDGPALVLRTVCLRAILDHVDPALAGQLHDRIHVARPAGQVHADDCSGIGGKYGFDGPRGDILRVSVY